MSDKGKRGFSMIRYKGKIILPEPTCTRSFTGKHKWETGWTNEYEGRTFSYPLPICGYCGMIDDREVNHYDKT